MRENKDLSYRATRQALVRIPIISNPEDAAAWTLRIYLGALRFEHPRWGACTSPELGGCWAAPGARPAQPSGSFYVGPHVSENVDSY